jgi:hypothetical protein
MDDDRRARTAEAERRSRELAARLADTASDVADPLERAAELHEAMAADEHHPRREGAAAHAAREREVAAHEREESSRLRSTAGDG